MTWTKAVRCVACSCQADDGSFAAEAVRPGTASELAADFRRKMAVMHQTLSSDVLARNQRAPFLRQFLLRLNFNGFLEA
jgi:hypothetical protein